MAVSISTAGMLVTAYALGISVGGPVLIALSIRFRRRFLLWLSLAAYIAGNVVAVVAVNFGMLPIARIVTGSLHGLFIGVAFAVADGLVPPERVGRAISMVFGGIAVSIVLGVPLGTLSGQELGWRAAFIAIVILGAVALVSTLVFVPPVENTGTGGFAAQARHALAPRMLAVLGVGFLLMGGQFAALTYLTPFLEEATGISGGLVSVFLLAYGIANAVGTFVGGWAADRGATETLVVANALLILALGMLYLVGSMPILVSAALAAWGLVGFGFVPSLQYRVVSLAGPGRHLPATPPASAVNAGIAAGALVGGWAVANNGASAAVTTGLVICVIVLPATWATRFLKVPAADNGVETVASAVAEAAPSNLTRRDERSLMTSSTATADRPPLAGAKGENVILLSVAPVDAARRTGNGRRPLWSFVISVMCAMTLTAGCSSPTEDQPSSSSSSIPGTEQAQVGQHASDNPGSVNTFWLETSQGLVVVDGQRTLSDARRALAAIQDTGQPVVAILITHAHPDHVGGLGVLHEAYPQTPIYASEATLATMRADPLGFYALTREQLGDDYPAELTYPDQLFRPEETLEVSGVRLETAEFGPAESEAATVYYEPNTGTLFSGDLINNQATPALLEGHTCGWLNDLDRLRDTFPDARTIYPGHGSPGDPDELMDQQWTYLESFRGLVRPAVSPSSPAGESVSPDEQESIIEELERLYPGYQSVASLPTLLEENVAAVARELLAEDTANLPPACRGS